MPRKNTSTATTSLLPIYMPLHSNRSFTDVEENSIRKSRSGGVHFPACQYGISGGWLKRCKTLEILKRASRCFFAVMEVAQCTVKVITLQYDRMIVCVYVRLLTVIRNCKIMLATNE